MDESYKMSAWSTLEKFKVRADLSYNQPYFLFGVKEAIDFTPELRNGTNVRNLETGKMLTFLSRKGNVYSFLGGIVILKDNLITNYELMDR